MDIETKILDAFQDGDDVVKDRALEVALVEIERLRADADRYNWLRNRDLDTISQGGVFAGVTPENVILNEEDLDRAIDAAMNRN